MLDKNLVAFVRMDAKTVTVTHGYNVGNDDDDKLKKFTYITVLGDLQPDDVVLVHNQMGLALATVVEVDDEVKIEPNAEQKYAWIVAKVDMESILALQAENEAIESAMQQQYTQNMRRSYRLNILAGLAPEALARRPASVRGDMAAVSAPAPRPDDVEG